MKETLLWIVMACFAALATHIGYVLLTPKLQMDSWTASIEAEIGSNRMAGLSPGLAASLFGTQSHDMLWAVCLYDLSRGDVEIKAEIPASYWLMSAYSQTGDNFYSINDRQADLRSILVNLTRSGEAEDDAASSGVLGQKLAVFSPTDRGLVVMQTLVPHPSLAKRFRAQLDASTCGNAGASN